MTVGIDIRKLGHLGIGTYIENLILSLGRLPGHPPMILFGDPDSNRMHALDGDYRIVPNLTGQYSFRGMVSLARQSDAAHIDLFHTPHYVLPSKMKARTVVTINDIIPLLFPEQFGIHKRAYAWAMMRRSCRNADRIITISLRTADDLRERFGNAGDRLRPIPLGVNESFRPLDQRQRAAVRTQYSLPEGYCLYSGAFKQHKNLPRLIEALARIPAGTRPLLVLMGDDIETAPHLKAAIERHRVSASVRILGKLPFAEVVKLYGAAHALLHPSLYEGFGLTVLEAMASGVPVASSSAGSLPEVAGDAALLFNPRNVDEMADAIGKITIDSVLREEYIRRGKERSAAFTWEACARATLAVYRELAG